MGIGFDNDLYIAEQAGRIRERIGQFGGKLYLEFGGKIFDDFHAGRVLPGFAPDAKIQMLRSMAADVEVLFAVNANHVECGKVRADLGITYAEEVLRLMGELGGMGFLVGKVVLTQYAGQPGADAFRRRLESLGIKSYLHVPIEGYPDDVARVVSEEGYGRNEFVETERPLVVVTGPGPCSGKLATCLSQLYHEHRRGVAAGYAKYETFPVWNLPLHHPVNEAYEAATADLGDFNVVDPFHLEAYGQTAVNYNRDVAAFPVLRALMEKIMGECPYKSPTDMGVNMAGAGIVDDEACRLAARAEVARRYFRAAVAEKRTGAGRDEVERLAALMERMGVEPDEVPGRKEALAREEKSGCAAGAIVLPDGRTVTGKASPLMGSAASALLNALKELAGEREGHLLGDEAVVPVFKLKTEQLRSPDPRLNSEEALLALTVCTGSDERAARCHAHLGELRGADAFFTTVVSPADERLYRDLGINLCCEPRIEESGCRRI